MLRPRLRPAPASWRQALGGARARNVTGPMSQFRSNIPSAESRKAPRQRVHHPAMVNRDDGTPLLNCMIWDVSALGAKLTVAADERIPDQFMLLFHRGGGSRWCRVIWRTSSKSASNLSPAGFPPRTQLPIRARPRKGRSSTAELLSSATATSARQCSVGCGALTCNSELPKR